MSKLAATNSAVPPSWTEASFARAAEVDKAFEEIWRRHQEDGLDLEAYLLQNPDKESLVRLVRFQANLEEAAAQAPLCWPAPGESYLGFTLQRELGRGTFSRVFLAHEPALGNRQVAVKISRVGAAEAKTIGPIKHPNIVPVYSVKEDWASGMSVICMPYLGEATLDDVVAAIKQGQQLPDRAGFILDTINKVNPVDEPAKSVNYVGTYIDGVIGITAQLAEAIAFLYGMGICHGDLKPSNVLMTPAGRPMLLDFNLSAEAEAVSRQVGGTLPFMAPEKLMAFDQGPLVSDQRSDIYSLGVMLYELLSGVRPFDIPAGLSPREGCALLLGKQRSERPSMGQANPAVSKSLALLIESCLSFNPQDRPQTAAELAVSLRRFLKPWHRAGRWISRHRWLAAGIATTATVALLAAAIIWYRQDPYWVRQTTAGIQEYHAGRFDQAMVHFQQALDASPDAAGVLFARGRVFLRRGAKDKNQFNLAMADFKRVHELNQDPRALACLGYCASRLGQTKTAINHYHQALEAGYAPAALINNLGYNYLKANDLDKARHYLDLALQLDDRLQAAYHNRALVGFNLGSRTQNPMEKASLLAKGIADLQKAIKLGTESAELFKDAAYCCAIAANIEERWATKAKEYLARAVALGYSPAKLQGDIVMAPYLKNLVTSTDDRPALPSNLSPRELDPVAEVPLGSRPS